MEVVKLVSVISESNIEIVEELQTGLGYSYDQLLAYLFNHALNLTKVKLIKLEQEVEMLKY